MRLEKSFLKSAKKDAKSRKRILAIVPHTEKSYIRYGERIRRCRFVRTGVSWG